MLAKKSVKVFIVLFTIIFCNFAQANYEHNKHYESNFLEVALKIAGYITNIKTAAIEFTQQDSDGNIAKGMLLVDKPYKFRCNYYEPFPLLIVGNKNYISVYDYEMKYVARIKTSENAFNFLLLDQADFQDQFEILHIKNHEGEYIVKLQNNIDDKISEIVFDKNFEQLKKLTIYEEDHHIILTFDKTFILAAMPQSLFILQNPDIFGEPDRFSQADLYKKLKIAK
ncbi:MAG: outer-membrane lipoprotein carrier protein LolA [Rickettsiaceae bacterium]|nr:outer-membrane lipoprotein carrier protein LolA [Rickettsiaceae bacterium]